MQTVPVVGELLRNGKAALGTNSSTSYLPGLSRGSHPNAHCMALQEETTQTCHCRVCRPGVQPGSRPGRVADMADTQLAMPTHSWRLMSIPALIPNKEQERQSHSGISMTSRNTVYSCVYGSIVSQRSRRRKRRYKYAVSRLNQLSAF